jgi:hypothetical protein
MWTFTIFLSAALAFSEAELSEIPYIPKPRPTGTRDPWQCVTMNLTKYWDGPMPTGSLSTAVHEYGYILHKKICTSTGTNEIKYPLPVESDWCGFSSRAPATILTAWRAYGSMASSWWAAHSSAASSVSIKCPQRMYDAMPCLGDINLNQTIFWGNCYAKANPTGGSLTTAGPTDTARSGPTAAAGAQPTRTNSSSSSSCRTESLKNWLVVSTGFAAVAVNEVL